MRYISLMNTITQLDGIYVNDECIQMLSKEENNISREWSF